MSTTTDSHAYSDLAKCDTNNATRIGWNDWEGDGNWPADYRPENKRSYYQHLDRYNSGRQNGHKWQNSSYETYELNRNLIQCMSDKLRLDSWEVKRAIQLFDALQRSCMGLPSEVVAFSTCAYVIHRYDENRDYHPQTKEEDRDYFLEACRKDFGISQDWFESVYGKVSHKIRNGKINLQQHDDYEVDSHAEQSWRPRNDSEDGWL